MKGSPILGIPTGFSCVPFAGSHVGYEHPVWILTRTQNMKQFPQTVWQTMVDIYIHGICPCNFNHFCCSPPLVSPLKTEQELDTQKTFDSFDRGREKSCSQPWGDDFLVELAPETQKTWMCIFQPIGIGFLRGGVVIPQIFPSVP